MAVGALGWWLQFRPAQRVDASALATLPLVISDWQGEDIPLGQTVEAELRADFNLQRIYLDRGGVPIWIYLGYYGTDRGGRPEHTPRFCYTGAGWSIDSAQTISLDPAHQLRAKEYLVSREGERRLVVFWYRSHRRTGMTGGLDQNLDRMAGRLFAGRADGALIRTSTPLEGDDVEGARARLVDFARTLDALVAARWPEEVPLADSAPGADAILAAR